MERRPAPARTGQEGFTLVEAMIAIVILVFGLMAIANLYAVAGSSNTAANHGTVAASLATEKMEELKGLNFDQLSPCSNLNLDEDDATCQEEITVPGVGIFRTRWVIAAIPGDNQVKYLAVRTQSLGGTSGQRSRAEFTSFRSCTVEKNGLCPP